MNKYETALNHIKESYKKEYEDESDTAFEYIRKICQQNNEV